MKRTAEFIVGLIGGIFGLLMSSLCFIGILSYTNNGSNEYSYLIITFGISLIIQIGIIVLTCCVNKMNNKVFGICMIILSVISLFFSLFALTLAVILQIISGALAFRTLQQEDN